VTLNDGTTRCIHCFSRVRRLANVARYDGAARHPRIRDLQHTFAVHSIEDWQAQGVDVNKLLPILAEYVGSLTVAKCDRYLKLTPFKVCRVPIGPHLFLRTLKRNQAPTYLFRVGTAKVTTDQVIYFAALTGHLTGFGRSIHPNTHALAGGSTVGRIPARFIAAVTCRLSLHHLIGYTFILFVIASSPSLP
jgi:hypothetical protein